MLGLPQQAKTTAAPNQYARLSSMNASASNNVTIRPAVIEDVKNIVGLISEMEAFYGSSDPTPVDVQAAMVRKVLFDDNMGTHVLVAHRDDTLLGLASFAFVWPAASVSRSIYLKDLYVLETHRGHGVGSQLLDAVKQLGREHECSRIDWTVDNSNDEAFGFYDRIGAFTSDKVGYRLLL
jgi:ribosomal protein S18 acetylase RimI-like enzyme